MGSFAAPRLPPQPPKARRTGNFGPRADQYPRRGRYHAYSQAWSSSKQEAAEAANTPDRIQAAAELHPYEQVRPLTVDMDDCERFADTHVLKGVFRALGIQQGHLSFSQFQ